MTNVVPITALTRSLLERRGELQTSTTDRWQSATHKSRSLANQREEFLRPLLKMVAHGVSTNVAIKNVIAHVECGQTTQRYIDLAYQLGHRGKLPGRSTIHGWIKAYQSDGKQGLLDNKTGRVRKDRGWEALAIKLYNIPSKPSYVAVAKQLREVYDIPAESATDSSVARYLKSLPARLNTNSEGRLGKHFHNLNRKSYVMRDMSVLDVGEVYEGDGHCIDAYIARQSDGGPWRPELTIWIDVASRCVVGWYMSTSESSLSTLFALSHAMIKHDHVPNWVHIDNGSGFKSKLMSDESVGYYARFAISQTVAIPGNSKGKGLVEHWFRTFRDEHDKFWNGGADYCGHDQSPDALHRINDNIKSGKRKLLSLEQYTRSVADYIERYNARIHTALNGKSPNDLWSQLTRNQLIIPAEAVLRPSVKRVVNRNMVRHENRYYEHPMLTDYHAKSVVVEYDIHDDSKAWLYDDKKRLICEAPLKHKKAFLPDSRREEAKLKSTQGKIDRLQKKVDLVKAEAISHIDHTHTLDALEKYGADAPSINSRDDLIDSPTTTLDIDIDIDNTLDIDADQDELTININQSDINQWGDHD